MTTSTASQKAFREELEILRRVYLDELPARIGSIKTTAAAIAARGWDREGVETLYRETHRLAGSSGLYRMLELSRSAAALEEAVKQLLTAPAWPPNSSPDELTTLVDALGRTARSEAEPA